MGNYWSRTLRNGPPYRILMAGLDGAGKTTILYKLKLGDPKEIFARLGADSVTSKYVVLTTLDVGGRCKMRPLQEYFYKQTHGIIFVVDSIDRDRLEEARYELFDIVKDERLAECPVLLLANKQDLSMAMKTDELTKELGLGCIKQKWAIFPTSATDSMKGILNAFKWLGDALETRDLKEMVVNPVEETVDDVYTSVTRSKGTLSNILLKQFAQMKKLLSR